MGQGLGCPRPSGQASSMSASKPGTKKTTHPMTPSSTHDDLSKVVFEATNGAATTRMWGVESRDGRGVFEKPSRALAWAAHVEPAKADMDRFAVCVRSSSARGEPASIVAAGVFDGHGIHGQTNWGASVAQLAARRVVEACSLPFGVALDAETERKALCRHIFLEFQRRHEERYDRDVAAKVDDERSKFEAQHGYSPGARTLPAEGGCTATVARLEGDSLALAWVGDSRCVLGSVSKQKVPTARALTTDHNVTTNLEERDRCEAAGGHVLGRFLGTTAAEGMLQVTRSLGDRAHHQNDVLLAEPDYCQLELAPEHRFVLVASDGLWDHLTDAQAVDILCNQLFVMESPDDLDDDPLFALSDDHLAARLHMAAQNLVKTSNHKRLAAPEPKKPDDTSCLLVLFRPAEASSSESRRVGRPHSTNLNGGTVPPVAT